MAKAIRDMKYDDLVRILDYNPETGEIRWLDRSRETSPTAGDGEIVRWNKRFSGRISGCVAQDGYGVLTVRGIQLKAHRVCWALANQSDVPCDAFIDHINGDRTDNRADNLRICSSSSNSRNVKLCTRNKTGVKGVTRRGNKYEAYISTDGGRVYLGRFHTLSEAQAVRKSWEQAHGYSGNHGRA